METAQGMDAAVLMVGLIVVRQAFEMIAKAIPDSATGAMAGLRMLFKALAGYIPNKT